MSVPISLLLVSLGAFLSGVVLTCLARAVAWRLGVVAAPRADRWHARPTAMLSGVAIYAACVGGYLVYAPPLRQASPILIAGTFLFVTGLLDDVACCGWGGRVRDALAIDAC